MITQEFRKVMVTLFELYDKEATESKMAVYWSVLKQHDILMIRKVANAWVKKSEFLPKPADLIRMLGGLGHVSADEAWAIAVEASNPASTVIWTSEIAKAWSLAEIIYKSGDKVGARRTFIAAYERQMDNAIINNRLPEAIVSLGTNKDLRTEALNKAVYTGMLSQEQASLYLPGPENTFAMLEHRKNKTNPEKHLVALKAMIRDYKKETPKCQL